MQFGLSKLPVTISVLNVDTDMFRHIAAFCGQHTLVGRDICVAPSVRKSLGKKRF